MDFFERYLLNLRNKTKSKFLFFGILNFLITQIILGLTLLFLPVYIATFLSQTTNVVIGYFIYSRFVFDFKKTPFKALVFLLFEEDIKTVCSEFSEIVGISFLKV